MKTSTYLTAALATAALIGLSGCGGSSDKNASDPSPPPSSTSMPMSSSGSTSKSPATKSAPAAQSAMITISNFDFGKPISVSPGAMVMVMNDDTETHTVTADSGDAFDATATAGGSTTFKAPTKAGSYPFHCSFHSDMHGTLTVK